MKKKLEAELVSLAHRVLKLTGKEDLDKMQKEIALLYQKITVLKFFQDQFNGKLPENLENNTSFFNSIEYNDEGYTNTDNNQEDVIMEPAIEKIKDIVAQMPEEASAVDELFEKISLTKDDKNIGQITESFGQIPMFDPVGKEEKQDNLEPKTSFSQEKKVSLEENLKSEGFQIGLNDRLAFVNHLFENNNEDYDRVISQLTTMDSLEEISDFIENIIKPDYNNWEGKKDYESRFLDIIGQNFN